MSVKKQFLKSKPECKVSFKVEKDVANGAKTISLVGDFNGWDKSAHPMKALKDGSFSVTINLAAGNAYQFRYLADNATWLNEAQADKMVWGGVGEEQNSVIAL